MTLSLHQESTPQVIRRMPKSWPFRPRFNTWQTMSTNDVPKPTSEMTKPHLREMMSNVARDKSLGNSSLQHLESVMSRPSTAAHSTGVASRTVRMQFLSGEFMNPPSIRSYSNDKRLLSVPKKAHQSLTLQLSPIPCSMRTRTTWKIDSQSHTHKIHFLIFFYPYSCAWQRHSIFY